MAFLVCGLAKSFEWLLLGRVLQGVAAGLLLSSGPALAMKLYPESHRARALALYAAGLSGAGALGPILGGALLSRFDWSCVFWARAPLALLSMLLSFGIPRSVYHRVRAEFEWQNALWLVAAMTSLTLAIGFARSGLLAGIAGLMASISAALFADNQRRAHKPGSRPSPWCRSCG